ncbi:MAG: hypothetical protein ABJF88_16520 [Rhodothermales bacterium]
MKIPHHRLSAAAAYERVQTPPAPSPARPAAPPADAAPANAAAATSALSADEQQMIDRYFPPQPKLELRLYGPGREAQTVSPGAVGGRLDLSA